LSQLRGIEADFANWRTVQGRKVLQLVFEVPIEKGEDALKMLGMPQPGVSRWCAIALLKPEAVGQAKAQPSGSSKPFASLPLSQQAAIRCGDTTFQEFMGVMTDEGCADQVRQKCFVESRSLIIGGSPAGAIWKQLEAQYQRWLTDRNFAEAKR